MQSTRSTRTVHFGLYSPTRTAIEVVQRDLGLKGPSLGACQFSGRILDGGNVFLPQFAHRPLPETSEIDVNPKSGKGKSKLASPVYQFSRVAQPRKVSPGRS